MKRLLSFGPALVLAFTLAPTCLAQVLPAEETTLRIRALESLGRARPTEAAAQLEQLRTSTPEFSPQRLELLTVQGLMLAVASQAEGAESVAATLDTWGRKPGVALAKEAAAATLLVRARSTARSGDLRRAEAMLQEAIEHLPTKLLALHRLRLVAALGYIKNESGKLEDAVRLNHEALALADQLGEPWRQAEARSFLAYSYTTRSSSNVRAH